MNQSNRYLNYSPQFSELQTLKIRHRLRIFLNHYYEHDLNLFSVPAPFIKQFNQNDYFDLFNKINFSHNPTHKTYQIISNQAYSLKKLIAANDFENNNGFYALSSIFDKNFDATTTNLVNEYDFLEIKLMIDQGQEATIINHLQKIWDLILAFINENQMQNTNPYYDDLLIQTKPVVQIYKKSLKNQTLFNKSQQEIFESAIFTNKLIISKGIHLWSQQLSNVHNLDNNENFYCLFYLDADFNIRTLVSAYVSPIDNVQYKKTLLLSLCVNFSAAVSLVTFKKSVQELNFLYCQKNSA